MEGRFGETSVVPSPEDDGTDLPVPGVAAVEARRVLDPVVAQHAKGAEANVIPALLQEIQRH
jgi:hypothetical protein